MTEPESSSSSSPYNDLPLDRFELANELLVEYRKDIKVFKAFLAEKSRLDNEYGQSLLKLSDSLNEAYPSSSSTSQCWESIRDTLRVFGEKHKAKATMLNEISELSKMKETSDKLKAMTEKNRVAFEKATKEFKNKIQIFEQCQDLYVKAFKEFEHAIRKQKDAVSKGAAANKMKLASKVQTQANNLVKASADYHYSFEQTKESQKNYKAKLQGLINICGNLEFERLESIRQGMGMYIACEEDSGYRSDMNKKHEAINVQNDIRKFISEEPSLRSQPSLLLKNFEKITLTSQLFQMTDQGPVIIEEEIERNETPSNEYRVLWNYVDPEGDPDGLQLTRGDIVCLKETIHPDWGYGHLARDSKQEGYFPMNRAEFRYQANASDEINLRAGELIKVFDSEYAEGTWLEGVNTQGNCGFFPANFVRIL